jgi:hypothetical protein
MKIQIPISKFVREYERLHSNSTTKSLFNINANDISIILICSLYHHKNISKEQFHSYFNKYKSKQCSLTRFIKTYKCKINNKWYNDMNFTSILLDICKLENHKNISFDDFLVYLNLGFNKNKNWCLNYVGSKIFIPILNSICLHRHQDLLSAFGFLISNDTMENYINHEIQMIDSLNTKNDIEYLILSYKKLIYHFLIKTSPKLNIVTLNTLDIMFKNV